MHVQKLYIFAKWLMAEMPYQREDIKEGKN